MKPSIYQQLGATQVAGNLMMPSPRSWNCGMMKYKGRLWMAYRYHLAPQHGSRCATAMVPLDKETFQPTLQSQHLNLRASVGDEHFEDARLFLFKGEPYISYTKMTGYQPGVDYRCTMEYARLKLKGSTWHVEETFHPEHGQNTGWGKEKNWIFFEGPDQKLYCVYQDTPTHRVLQIEGEKVIEVFDTPAATWQWGHIRGGTPPVPYGDGSQLLFVFHSSLQTEDAPHYRRYYGGAYLTDAKPPFAIKAVTVKPLMSGSELDGHGQDPRYSAGWKPFIPFPCGLVPDNAGWLVSLGVNDWQCAVGRITPEKLVWMPPDGSGRPMRYFSNPNGSLPIKLAEASGPRWFAWKTPTYNGTGRGAMAPTGYFATDDGRLCEVIEEMDATLEITEAEYNAGLSRKGRSLLLV